MRLIQVFDRASGHYRQIPKDRADMHQCQPDAGDLEFFGAQGLAFRDKLQDAGDILTRLAGGEFYLADNKSLGRAKKKTSDDPQKARLITDHVRGSIMIETPAQAAAFMRLFNTQGRDGPIRIGDHMLLSCEDNFAEPMPNGLRRMMLKIEMTNEKGERHVGEIQVRVKGMQEAEDLTHKIYEVRRSFDYFARTSCSADYTLHKRLNKFMGECTDLIKAIHDGEAGRLGFDALILSDYQPSKGVPKGSTMHKVLSRSLPLEGLRSGPPPASL